MPFDDLFEEAARQLNVRNACRYCTGYCPVWPALEFRRELTKGDINHLANLCHDCRDCFTACMYTEPPRLPRGPPAVRLHLRTGPVGHDRGDHDHRRLYRVVAAQATCRRPSDDPTMRGADIALLWALIALNVTGLGVLVLRTTSLFGPALVVHLLTVLVAFTVAPYTKFVHWVFRLLAMVNDNLERSRQVPCSRHS